MIGPRDSGGHGIMDLFLRFSSFLVELIELHRIMVKRRTFLMRASREFCLPLLLDRCQILPLQRKLHPPPLPRVTVG